MPLVQRDGLGRPVLEPPSGSALPASALEGHLLSNSCFRSCW